MKSNQRCTLKQLQVWEKLGYGMFIHFGMSTFIGKEVPDGTDLARIYNPDQLDVDQWVSVARDSGMKYAVLTAKHASGFCLWPSKHTDYTVAKSRNKTDVVEKFVNACEKRKIKPGIYYNSYDNHHRFGGRTPSETNEWDAMNYFPRKNVSDLAPFTTSLYQSFQTAQVTELLTDYGAIAEMWIDIPGLLGRGYRTFLYNHIAALQPKTIIMMNSGFSNQKNYNVDYAWPSDLISIERSVPPEKGHEKWRVIEGKDYYLPGEVCDTLGKEWFWLKSDSPRSDQELLKLYSDTRVRAANLLLDVGPDRHGLIPKESVLALSRLQKNAGI